MAEKSDTKKPLTQKRLMCNECKKPISRKAGAYVIMGTYNLPAKPDHEAAFHFPCFVDWHNAKVNEKAMGIVGQQGMININSLINDPELQKLAKNVMGGVFEEEKPKKKAVKKASPKHNVKAKKSGAKNTKAKV